MCLENVELKMLPDTLFTVEPVIVGEISASALLQIRPEMNCLVYPITGRARKKHLLWNRASKWMVWLYLWSRSMGICRKCIFPSSSCNEMSSLPYLIPLHECSCSGIHCLLMLSIQCTHCASSSAWEGIKIHCSSQTNIFKIKPCARKDFRNSRI